MIEQLRDGMAVNTQRSRHQKLRYLGVIILSLMVCTARAGEPPPPDPLRCQTLLEDSILSTQNFPALLSSKIESVRKGVDRDLTATEQLVIALAFSDMDLALRLKKENFGQNSFEFKVISVKSNAFLRGEERVLLLTTLLKEFRVLFYQNLSHAKEMESLTQEAEKALQVAKLFSARDELSSRQMSILWLASRTLNIRYPVESDQTPTHGDLENDIMVKLRLLDLVFDPDQSLILDRRVLRERSALWLKHRIEWQQSQRPHLPPPSGRLPPHNPKEF